jgi:predicted RNA-binding Zn-ribbon protein involved in translation (DUF1610 family)
MSAEFVKALCAKCQVPPEPVTDDNGEERFACPVCGEGDTRDNILREVGEHVKEVAARHLQEAARDVSRRSKFITFSGDPIPKGSYRFVSDYKI